jgi:hypothetical protein
MTRTTRHEHWYRVLILAYGGLVVLLLVAVVSIASIGGLQ